MKRSFQYADDKSNKFWTIETDGNDMTVNFGKIGTAGQTQTKAFADDAACGKEAEKLIREKTKKGYVEVALPEAAAVAVADAPPKAESKSDSRPDPKPDSKPKADLKSGPKAVKDDGTVKPWHGEDGWACSWYFPGEAAFANLDAPLDEDDGEAGNRNAAGKGAGNGAAGVSDAEAGIDEDDDEDDRAQKRARWYNAHTPLEQLLAEWREKSPDEARLRKWIGNNIGSAVAAGYRYRDAQPYIDALRLLISDDAEFQAQMVENLSPGIHDIFAYGHFDSDDLERLVWLAERGAKLKLGRDAQADPEKVAEQHLVGEYAKNPDPARIEPIYREFVAERMADYAPKLVQAFEAAIQKFLRGEGEIQALPPGAIGFQLRSETAYLRVSGEASTRFAKLGLDLDATGVTDFEDAAKGMEAILPALLTELADRGGFDGLREKGLVVLQIVDINGKLLFQRTLDEACLAAQREAMLTLVASLEKTEDFEAAAPGLKDGASALLGGVWLPADMERGRALLRKFLYSGNEAAQEAANDMLDYYDGRYPELQFDRARWVYANGNYRSGKRVMGWAKDKGYAPATEALVRFSEEDAARAARNAAFAQAKTGAKKGKIGKDNFDDVFGENDLLLKTENVLARANVQGRIFIRFKIEGEEAYSEALDWLCRLLEKDYASLNGGYEIYARFLIKPEFVKALNAARNREEDWGFAKTSCHAFFARAVQYPALREKVKRYAELALNLFDWYRDIDGEENCVTGTFAACALAFAEEKYVPLVGLFARNSDNEHQYCQVFLPGPLFKQYGATPEVAAACFDLSASNGQDNDINLNAALLTTPACLRSVMEHLENNPGGMYEDRFLKDFVPSYVEAIWSDNVKGNLKKFKAFADGAKTPEDRNAFVDFHNFYKKYAAELNGEDYGPDLGAADEKKDVVVPVWRENPPVLTPVAEAKKADLTWKADDEYDDTRGVFFFPVCIDDPALLDHVYRQWESAPRNIQETFIWGTDNAFRFGSWAWNPAGLAQAWGVLLTDGKNKPCLLYGVLNAAQLSKQWARRVFKSPEEAEAARQAALLRDMPPPGKLTAAEKALDEKMNAAFSAAFGKHWWLAGQLLQAFCPEHGRYYDAALLLSARRAESIEEYAQAGAAYDEFARRRPEFAADIAAKKAGIGKGKKT